MSTTTFGCIRYESFCGLDVVTCSIGFQTIEVRAVFAVRARQCILALLCAFQFLIPPMLIYHKGMAPFNCYGLWIGHMLPTRSQVDFMSLGAFGLYFHERPEQTHFFSGQCPAYFQK